MSVTGLNTLQTGRESALKRVVGRVGPVAVAIDVGHQTFQLYTSGVYVDSACRNDIQSLNHGVLAVGYGSERGQDYWVLRTCGVLNGEPRVILNWPGTIITSAVWPPMVSTRSVFSKYDYKYYVLPII